MSILFGIMSLIVISDCSLLFAETYQWTDADGSVHFSDSPMNIPKDKQLIVHQDETNNKSSVPPQKTSPTKNKPSKKASGMPEQACMQETENASKICAALMQSNLKKCWRERLSTNCLNQVDVAPNQRKSFDPACKQELKDVSVPCSELMMSSNKQCMNENLSPNCRKQSEAAGQRILEKTKICNEAVQKMIRICGTGKDANEKCYKTHRAELEGICSEN